MIIVLIFYNFSSIYEFDKFNEEKNEFKVLSYNIQNGIFIFLNSKGFDLSGKNSL
jgi:hypothetical protein